MLNIDDVRNHTEIGTGYSKDAMLNLCADELTTLRQQLSVAVEAMTLTIEENLYLADGDDCTLHRLNKALAAIKEMEAT